MSVFTYSIPRRSSMLFNGIMPSLLLLIPLTSTQEHPPITKFPRPVASFTHNAHLAAFASIKTTNQSWSIPAAWLEHLSQCQMKNQEQNEVFHTEYYNMDGHSLKLKNEESAPVTTKINKPPMSLPVTCIAIGLLFITVFVMHQTYSSNDDV